MSTMTTYTVGITGGIATGKSTALQILKAKMGLKVICTDQISKDISKKPNIIKQISKHFGKSVITDKQINRVKLREIIIKSKKAKKWLEDYLHPFINREVKRQINQSGAAIIVVDIPLLAPYNIQYYSYLNKVIVMKSDLQTRIKRIITRDRRNKKQATEFIKLQISDRERAKIADYEIDNSSLTKQELQKELKKIIINDIKNLTNINSTHIIQSSLHP